MVSKTDIESCMKSCVLCVRRCGINRMEGAGRCGETYEVRAARAALHMWEEPVLSGRAGSGAVFFEGCPVGCVFCQNHEIALGRRAGRGRGISLRRLAEIFLSLQGQGAHNINLVTPTHFIPQIILAVREAREAGLRLPIVYNTASVETPESVRMLRDTVDIFLPDLKYADPELAGRYSRMPGYFQAAAEAIREMVAITGEPVLEETPQGLLMKRGTIVRHLILPGQTEDSTRILRYLHETYGNRIFISIMNQYTPMPGIRERYPELGRPLTKREYAKVVDYAISLGIGQAFIQEGATAAESFIPAFDGEGIW